MKAGSRFFALGVAVAAVACATNRDQEPAGHLCAGTGTSQLSFGALSLPPPARVVPGMHVMFENGSSFFYVDDSCHYWAKTPADAWSEVRTGVLTRTQELALAARLGSSNWDAWAGEQVPRDGISDANLLVLMPQMSIDSMIMCFGGCAGEPVPAGLQTAAAEVSVIAAELWASGAAVTGDVRYFVVREEFPVPVPYLDWPLALNVSDIATSELDAASGSWGRGRSATGPDAASLRALRSQYLSSTTPELVPHIPVMDANGDRYKVFLRDSLPQEDASGLVRPQ